MPPRTCRTVGSIRLAGLAILLAAPLAGAGTQEKLLARVPCGAYEAVPSGMGTTGRPTRLSIQRDGRLLQTVSDWRITRVECADIDNDRTPELLVTSDSGGAHCCETLRVWTLGPTPAQVLEYEAGNAGGFELRDLDGDGRAELLVGDDSFAFYDDLCYACAPRYLPLVACLADGAFRDCTKRFPDVLRSWMARYTARMEAPADAAAVKSVEGAALGVLAISVLLGEEAAGVEAIRTAVGSDDVMRWLERARPKVRDWARTRGKKLKSGKK
jgi:hypothetical protein